MAEQKTLELIATKLGIGDKTKVKSKAAEFGRLLQIKTMAGTNISDTSKIIMCLDLAATLLNVDFDSKAAMKYTGLRPSSYTNYRKMVEKLLDLNSEKLTISTLCVALQCTELQSLADKILMEYQKQSKQFIDLNLPQYACIAVYHSSRLNKVKISKCKLVERSGLKPSQWAKLDGDWSRFVNENFANFKKTKTTSRAPKNTSNDIDQEIIDQEPMQVDEVEPNILEPKHESYEDWKRRMLEEAYKEIMDLENKQRGEHPPPRKSPRKTPQKITTKSGTLARGKAVKLLFPIQ